jgi:hypothetical protein
MAALNGFVRQILITAVFFSVVFMVIPDEKYKKFMKFFACAVIALLLIAPIQKVVRGEFTFNVFDELILSEQDYEDIGGQAVAEEYIRLLEGEIDTLAQQHQVSVTDISIKLNQDFSIQHVSIQAYIDSKVNINNLKTAIAEKLDINIHEIIVENFR